MPRLIEIGGWLTEGWFCDKLGRGEPHPFESSLEEIGRYNADKVRLAWEHVGEFGIGAPEPKPFHPLPQHDGRCICANAYGASVPLWDERSACFWTKEGSEVWEGLRTLEQVKKLPVPDWASNALVKQNIAKWEEAKAKLGAERAGQLAMNWTESRWTHPITGQKYFMAVVPNFIDLGGFLMSSTQFLSMLAAEPELAEALMAKCLEISLSYARFMAKLYGRPITSWSTLGGDNSCLLSPNLYRQFALAYDLAAWADLGWRLPVNLHSCGASKHLYGVWGEYPRQDQIVLMQTRAIPGAMKKLRESLPHTYVQLTIHQPQIDFENESPARIRELVWEFAQAMEFRNLSIGILFSYVNAKVKENLAAFYEAGRQVNEEARRLQGQVAASR